jgi:D-aminopeptidase
VSAPAGEVSVRAVLDGPWDGTSPMHDLFAAAVEATDEAVVNVLFAAETMVGRDGNTLYAMPVDRVLEVLDAAGRLRR